jgi:hypothetical protein|tara:strand:+ start:369 stop:992 length:624 start_codon:yes stop_codon:yes gene_type:complete
MAINEVDALAGNMQAEPRMFAHDMIPVAIGALNPENGLKMTSGGTGFDVGMIVTLTTPSSGSPAKIKVTNVDSSNAITAFDIIISGADNRPFGEGYALTGTADQVGTSTPSGGTGFTATVNNIDLPYTRKRGCCLYVGVACTSIPVLLESGKKYTGGGGNPDSSTHSVNLQNVTAGSFLPILAKQVTGVPNISGSGTYAAGQIVAIY